MRNTNSGKKKASSVRSGKSKPKPRFKPGDFVYARTYKNRCVMRVVSRFMCCLKTEDRHNSYKCALLCPCLGREIIGETYDLLRWDFPEEDLTKVWSPTR
jgi:hypothetical protein